MFVIACLIWIGIILTAPAWFYILLAVDIAFLLIRLGMHMGGK